MKTRTLTRIDPIYGRTYETERRIYMGLRSLFLIRRSDRIRISYNGIKYIWSATRRNRRES